MQIRELWDVERRCGWYWGTGMKRGQCTEMGHSLSVGAAEIRDRRNNGGTRAHRKLAQNEDSILKRNVVTDVVVDGGAVAAVAGRLLACNPYS